MKRGELLTWCWVTDIELTEETVEAVMIQKDFPLQVDVAGI